MIYYYYVLYSNEKYNETKKVGIKLAKKIWSFSNQESKIKKISYFKLHF